VGEFRTRHPPRAERVVEACLPLADEPIHDRRACRLERRVAAQLRIGTVRHPVQHDQEHRHRALCSFGHRGPLLLFPEQAERAGDLAALNLGCAARDPQVARHPEDVLEACGLE
jgi:hypothetical protein